MQETSVQVFFVKPAVAAASNLKFNALTCEHDSPKPAIYDNVLFLLISPSDS